MPDVIQQAVENAPAVGAGGLVGGGGLIAILKFFKVFASPQDVELVEARLRAEFAEKYVTQEMMKTVMEKLDNIQHRIDQLFDRKGV